MEEQPAQNQLTIMGMACSGASALWLRIISWPETRDAGDDCCGSQSQAAWPECGMGMLRGYGKVVGDIPGVDLQEIKKDIGNRG